MADYLRVPKMIVFVISLSVLALFIAMLCRSLVHQVTFNYPRTKERIKDLFGVEISDQWWNPFESWLNKNKIKWTIDVFGLRWITKVMVQFSDAFHTFNTIELGCYSLIISLWIIFALAFPWWYFLEIGQNGTIGADWDFAVNLQTILQLICKLTIDI